MERYLPKRKSFSGSAARFLKLRAGGSTGAGFSDFLDKVRDVEPEPADTLPPDLALIIPGLVPLASGSDY